MVIDFSNQTGKKISTKGDKRKFINIENIMYIKCEMSLTKIFLVNGTMIHEIKTLHDFEEELSGMGFFRIRDNIIINGNYITEMDIKIRNRKVKLGETVFVVARNRLRSFIKWIS